MNLFPRGEIFFDYFDEMAEIIEVGSKFFLEMAQSHDYSNARIARLKEIEHEADGITHKTYKTMHKTFIMPIDREDMCKLIDNMDNIMDLIESTAVLINLYKVRETSDVIIKQAQILTDCTAKGKCIIHDMRNMKNAEIILGGCVEIHTLENTGDTVLRSAISDLFENEKDPLELIKRKEIIELLEDAIDACEKTANIVEGIVMKNA